VETSGLALPEPLLAAFKWPEIRSRIWVNGVVTVVDGEALAQGSVVADPAALEAQRQADPSLDHLTAIDALFADQLAAADLVLISRADCLDFGQLEQVRERIGPLIREGTAVLPMARGDVAPELVLGPGIQSTAHSTGQHGDDHGHGHQHAQDHHDHEHHHHHHHHHDHDHDHHDHSHVAMESVVIRLEGSFERASLEPALLNLIRDHGIVRLKGRLWQEGKARPLEIQAVGPRLESWFAATASTQAAPARPGLELVALGFALPQDHLRACLEELIAAPTSRLQ
jgi:cobalamin biosynthesis protein CobW